MRKDNSISRKEFLGRVSMGLAGLAVGSGGCGPEAVRKRPNIVLIVTDTVRQDSLSAYGYHLKTSPFLKKLKGEATIYKNAYSTSSWTYPAHASLFTGLHPRSHGVHWGGVFLNALEAETLAEILSESGYRTLGLSENFALRADLHWDRGFEKWCLPNRNFDHNKLREFFSEALSGSNPNPFFIFLNLFSPHAPYNSSKQFLGTFLSDSSYENEVGHDWISRQLDEETFLDKKWLTHLKEHYDAELLFVDFLLKQLKKELEKHDLWDSTVFIVTSDHGEGFGEHGLIEHWTGMYEYLVKAPLLIRYPECFPAGTVEDAPVSINDLFPTILELAGIDPDRFPRQAGSLLADKLSPQRTVTAERYCPILFSQTSAPLHVTAKLLKRLESPLAEKYNRIWRMIRKGSMKLIFAEDYPAELYDLEKDPAEKNNLAKLPDMQKTKYELTHLLQERMGEFVESHPPPERTSEDLPKEVQDTMKALGYL